MASLVNDFPTLWITLFFLKCTLGYILLTIFRSTFLAFVVDVATRGPKVPWRL